jgi:hypothetical protein
MKNLIFLLNGIYFRSGFKIKSGLPGLNPDILYPMMAFQVGFRQLTSVGEIREK